MNVNLDLNPADFQVYGEFGLDKLCLTGFGFGDIICIFFAAVNCVSELWVTPFTL